MNQVQKSRTFLLFLEFSLLLIKHPNFFHFCFLQLHLVFILLYRSLFLAIIFIDKLDKLVSSSFELKA